MSNFSSSTYEDILKEDLSCFKCRKEFRNMPQLKAHLEEEWQKECKSEKERIERRRKFERQALERKRRREQAAAATQLAKGEEAPATEDARDEGEPPRKKRDTTAELEEDS